MAIDLPGRLRRALGDAGDYGAVRMVLVVVGLLLAGGRRLAHRAILSHDPIFRRFAGVHRVPADRTVARWMAGSAQAVIEVLASVVRDVAHDAIEALALPLQGIAVTRRTSSPYLRMGVGRTRSMTGVGALLQGAARTRLGRQPFRCARPPDSRSGGNCAQVRGIRRNATARWHSVAARYVVSFVAVLAFSSAATAEQAAHDAHATPGLEVPAAQAGLPPGMAELEVPTERRQLIGVRTVAIVTRPLVREIRTVGVVSTDERKVRRIQSRVSGWVEELFVSFTGEPVRAGQPILAVYSPELLATQREYLLALAAASNAGRSISRGTLLEAAHSRLRLFDVSEAQIIELARTHEPKRRVVLHSPIEGYVTFKPVLQGTYITPEMELYTVSDLTRVWIWAEVNEDEIPLLAVGQSAAIETSAAPGLREAVVAFLQPTLSAQTRTLRVRFDLDNSDGALRPGMYATVRIARPLGNVLALPDEAVIDTGVRRIVFVEVEPGRFQPREVELGRKGEDHYEVLRGLAAGERVVVSAQFLLDSESRLRGAGGPAHGAH